MKQFFKTTLAVLLGVFLVNLLGIFIFLGIVGSSVNTPEPTVPASAVLSIDMSRISLDEQTFDNPMQSLNTLRGAQERQSVGLYDAVRAIRKAETDPAIRFVYLKADGVSAGIASTEELRVALKHFRESGKAVYAYVENPGNASYYLASVADRVYMNSACGSGSFLTGFSSQVVYMKDLLDLLGVKVQLIRHGKYKSAGEPYITNQMSAANREQYEALLGSIWSGWCRTMAQARGLAPEELDRLIDNLQLQDARDFVKTGLADELLDKATLEERLTEWAGGKLALVSLKDYAAVRVKENFRSADKIAIVFADGEIVDGKDDENVDGDRFASILTEVRKDESVKAVVLRVNSPGGSVFASDKIKTAMDTLCKVKPVIGSYGNYAASGGYFISAGCRRIFADEGTLTGSIGVFSIVPDLSGTARKIAHVNVFTVSTHKHGDMLSGLRPLDKEELAYMQASVEDIYDTFTGLVARGRGLEQSYVDGIAQGRVWAGSDGLRVGLVDEIGTLDDAVRYAATLADGSNGSDPDDWHVVAYPQRQDGWEALIASLSQPSEETVYAGTPLKTLSRAYRHLAGKDGLLRCENVGKTFARMPYCIAIE